MEHASLYEQRAELYDRIYHFKDYAAESSKIRQILADCGVQDGDHVVEAACGTGSFLEHLRQHYRVAGFDLAHGMLEVARAKLGSGGTYGDVELWRADLTSFELREPADALLCLFSSIGYLFPYEQLAAAARRFAAALRKGGVAIVEPFKTPEEFEVGRASMQTYDGDDVKLVRCCVTKSQGQLAQLDFHWLVTIPGVGVEHHVERHELWLYTEEEMVRAFTEAGFEIRRTGDRLMPHRGLIIAML